MTATTLTPPGVNFSAHQTEDDRWQAILERDRSFDGTFVYAVRSTGIYCRPSCPSRKPGRHQVVFFPVPEAAERAEFRPCRRCQPHQHQATDPQLEMVRRVCNTIQQESDIVPTLAQLGQAAGASPYHLQRVFKQVMGITPRQYANAYRLGQLKGTLKEGQSVTDSLYQAGYGSSSRLYEQASTYLGMTPGDYRRGGKGIPIAYTVAASPLGRLLVAATQRGICAVSLGDDEADLIDRLRREYPTAQVQRDDSALGQWVGAIIEHLQGRLPSLDMPLDIRATAFQRQVWEELRRIPYGETRSYSEIARAIGRPRATRAVASACGRNPAAVVIPCHRVVREDGGLGGYKWGISRKEKLLEKEKTPIG